MGNKTSSNEEEDLDDLKKKYSLGKCFEYSFKQEEIFEDFVDIVLEYNYDNFCRKMIIILCTYMKRKRKLVLEGNYAILIKDFFNEDMGVMTAETSIEYLKSFPPELLITIIPSKGIVEDEMSAMPTKLTEARINHELEVMGKTEISLRSYVNAVRSLIREFEEEDRRMREEEEEEMMKELQSPLSPRSNEDNIFNSEEEQLLK